MIPAQPPKPALPEKEQCKKHPLSEMVYVDCQTCHGTGEVEWDDDACSNREMITCWRCRGSGISQWKECQWCLDEAADAEE